MVWVVSEEISIEMPGWFILQPKQGNSLLITYPSKRQNGRTLIQPAREQQKEPAPLGCWL
jgi:hypothetical protein